MKNSLKILIPALALFLVLCGFWLQKDNAVLVDSYQRTPALGEIAPDIALKDPSGTTRKLSDLRGQLVLLDFWASWCRPCRLENPHVVAAFKKYKSTKFGAADGFTVYSVSLDDSKEAWTSAIRKDGLNWENHVSDLLGWQSSAARQYNIQAIPSNFLIDEKGKIIAVNLTGAALEAELHKLKMK